MGKKGKEKAVPERYQLDDNSTDEDVNEDVDEIMPMPKRPRTKNASFPVQIRKSKTPREVSNPPPPRKSGKQAESSSVPPLETNLPVSTTPRRTTSKSCQNRQIVPHHFIDIDIWKKYFPRVMEAIQFQEWEYFLTLDAPIYIEHVREFYSGMVFKNRDQVHCEQIITTVYGKSITVSLDSLSDIMKAPNFGYRFAKAPTDSEVTILGKAYRPNVPVVMKNGRWPSSSKLFFDEKLLLFIYAKCFRPVSSSINKVSVELIANINKILEHVHVNLPHIVLTKMYECSMNAGHHLPYGALITKILDSEKIPLIGDTLAPKKAKIGVATFSQMSISIHRDKTIFWNETRVSGPNFVPLSREEEFANYPTKAPLDSDNEPENDQENPNIPIDSQVATTSSSSKCGCMSTLFTLMRRQGKAIRKAHRETRRRLGENVTNSDLDADSEEERVFFHDNVDM